MPIGLGQQGVWRQGSDEKKTWKRGAAGEGAGREKLEVWRGS